MKYWAILLYQARGACLRQYNTFFQTTNMMREFLRGKSLRLIHEHLAFQLVIKKCIIFIKLPYLLALKSNKWKDWPDYHHLWNRTESLFVILIHSFERNHKQWDELYTCQLYHLISFPKDRSICKWLVPNFLVLVQSFHVSFLLNNSISSCIVASHSKQPLASS